MLSLRSMAKKPPTMSFVALQSWRQQRRCNLAAPPSSSSSSFPQGNNDRFNSTLRQPEQRRQPRAFVDSSHYIPQEALEYDGQTLYDPLDFIPETTYKGTPDFMQDDFVYGFDSTADTSFMEPQQQPSFTSSPKQPPRVQQQQQQHRMNRQNIPPRAKEAPPSQYQQPGSQRMSPQRRDPPHRQYRQQQEQQQQRQYRQQQEQRQQPQMGRQQRQPDIAPPPPQQQQSQQYPQQQPPPPQQQQQRQRPPPPPSSQPLHEDNYTAPPKFQTPEGPPDQTTITMEKSGNLANRGGFSQVPPWSSPQPPPPPMGMSTRTTTRTITTTTEVTYEQNIFGGGQYVPPKPPSISERNHKDAVATNFPSISEAKPPPMDDDEQHEANEYNYVNPYNDDTTEYYNPTEQYPYDEDNIDSHYSSSPQNFSSGQIEQRQDQQRQPPTPQTYQQEPRRPPPSFSPQPQPPPLPSPPSQPTKPEPFPNKSVYFANDKKQQRQRRPDNQIPDAAMRRSHRPQEPPQQRMNQQQPSPEQTSTNKHDGTTPKQRTHSPATNNRSGMNFGGFGGSPESYVPPKPRSGSVNHPVNDGPPKPKPVYHIREERRTSPITSPSSTATFQSQDQNHPIDQGKPQPKIVSTEKTSHNETAMQNNYPPLPARGNNDELVMPVELDEDDQKIIENLPIVDTTKMFQPMRKNKSNNAGTQGSTWHNNRQYKFPPRERVVNSAYFASHAKNTTNATATEKRSLHTTDFRNPVYEWKSKLEKVENAIWAQNKGEKFNIQSPKQVSKILFGVSGESTNRLALEGIAAHNKMAELILEHRSLSGKIRKYDVREKSVQEGQTIIRSIKEFEKKDNTSSIRKMPTSSSASTLTTNDEDPLGIGNGDKEPLFLVDTSAYIFRAYYSMPPMHRDDGMPIGCVLGFCNMLNRLILNRLILGERPRFVLVMDAPGPTFRHEMYPDYKANRKEAPVDLIPQFDLCRDAADAYGLTKVEALSYEADDVIATLCRMATEEGIDSVILSGDKDLMQLVTPNNDGDGPSIQMMDPMTMTKVDYDVVVKKWGVPPELVGDVLALAGDASDNIPGVRGIGPKTATALLEEFGSLENLLKEASTIKQKARREKLLANEDMARLSRRLVELERKVPRHRMTLAENITLVSDLRVEKFDPDRLLQFYDDMGFVTIKNRLINRLKISKIPFTYQSKNKKFSSQSSSAMKKNGYNNDNYYNRRTLQQPREDLPF